MTQFYGKFVEVIGLHDFRCYLLACCFVEFDTSVICHLFMHFFCSFLLRDMFLRLQVFVFKWQSMKFSTGLIRTVCKCIKSKSYHRYHKLFPFCMSCIFTDWIEHCYRSNQSILMTRCGLDLRHQYGIFCGESQTSFLWNATRAGSEKDGCFRRLHQHPAISMLFTGERTYIMYFFIFIFFGSLFYQLKNKLSRQHK